MNDKEYQIISLGANCFPRRILTVRGIKPSKQEGELSYPFDLAVTPLKSVISILKNNFKDYFDNLKYDYAHYTWNNELYKIWYNHDRDCDDQNKSKFIERYQKRINNFNKALKESKYIYFTICSDDKFNAADVEELYSVLKRICDKNFSLIVLDFFSSELSFDEPNIEVISIPHPYENFGNSWWNDRYRLTGTGQEFENNVVENYKNIINQKQKLILYKRSSFAWTKKQIFINFADFPEPYMDARRFTPYDNIFTDILNKHYKVIISDKPDFVFYSVFGNTHKKYKDCVKIFFTPEVITPNFNECDYAIGFDYINFGERYLRYPLYYNHITEKILDRSHITNDFAKRDFCNFIYSNDSSGEGAILRKIFCQKLMTYKHVDCPGLVLNNMTNAISSRAGDFAAGKLQFQKKYKFTISFENNKYPGYTTEKLSQAFFADTIPIYYGNPDVVKDFNPKAFINCNDFKNMDEVIAKVIELDSNDEKYLEMLREPCVNNNYTFDKPQQLESFMLNIINKGNKPFNKNPNPCINELGYVGDIIPLVAKDSQHKNFNKKYKLLNIPILSVNSNITDDICRLEIRILGLKISFKLPKS